MAINKSLHKRECQSFPHVSSQLEDFIIIILLLIMVKSMGLKETGKGYNAGFATLGLKKRKNFSCDFLYSAIGTCNLN
jgi:hypothetical protein